MDWSSVLALWIVFMFVGCQLLVVVNGKGRRRDSDGGDEEKSVVPGEDNIDPNAEPYYGYYPPTKKIIGVAMVRNFKGESEIDNSVNGTVYFQQLGSGGPTWVNGTIHGLKPGLHGMAILELGDLIGGCNSENVGEHYNPLQKPHGSILATDRHCGDLGNINASSNGTAIFSYKVHLLLRLIGNYGVIGRMLVDHVVDRLRLVDTDCFDFGTVALFYPSLLCSLSTRCAVSKPFTKLGTDIN